MKNIFRNARFQHTRAPVLRKQLESMLFQKKKKKGYDRPRQGKAGCRKQKDQDKVLREMEKGDVRTSSGQGTADTVQNGRGQTFPEMDLQQPSASKHLVTTLSSGLKW